MRIVIVSSELAPFSKTGGLADVTGALGPALARRGHQVMTVSPRYPSTNTASIVDTGLTVGIHGGGWVHPVHYWRAPIDGVEHVLVDHAMFHRGGVYGDATGSYADNHIRFAVLCRAAMEAARRVPLADGAPMGEQVLFHSHDWPGALLPVFLEALYRPLGLFPWAPTVFTIHNLAHQGRLPSAFFADLDLAQRWFGVDGLEWYGDLHLLKGGLLTADFLTTVSPTYAQEIATPEQGLGLDGVLRRRQGELVGIVNGIDPSTWNPATDKHLAAHYGPGDLAGKAVCKATLQRELGLPVDASVPIVATVGRLDPQKGVELLLEAIPWLVREQGAQVVVLGSAAAAHAHYEQRLRELERTFPVNVRAWIGFSEKVAHQIEAGADLFAMPSLYEPCGLNQMYSMRYGTLPVVRATGGLRDTVAPIDVVRDTGTGFSFDWYDGRALIETLRHALWVWRHRPEVFRHAQDRAMNQDFGWDAIIPGYEAVYRRAFAKRGVPVDGPAEPSPAVAEAPEAPKRSRKKK